MKNFTLLKILFRKQKENLLEKKEWERLQSAIFIAIVPIFLIVHYSFLPKIPFTLKKWILEQSPLVKNLIKIYPVIVEHTTYSKPKPNQIPTYSSITSGGSGGITKEYGFHTLTDSDMLLISYTKNTEENRQKNQNQTSLRNKELELLLEKEDNNLAKKQNDQNQKTFTNTIISDSESKLPTKIPANYRFRNDFALRWDNSVSISIASVELKGYAYFRNMLRQIRENFSPPGLNLVWRDAAGLVISQTIKPQVVKVLFLLDEEGTVRDAKIVSSMGQKPVDDACIRVLLNQNFGKPPKEIFEHGNIFGINFIFPPIY